MSGSDKRGGFAVGAIVGAIAGAVAGILFAPKSGKETREDLKGAADELVSKLESQAEKLQAEIAELIDKGEAKAKTASKVVSGKTKEHVATAKAAQKTLRSAVQAFRSGEAEDKDLEKAMKKAKEAKQALVTYLKKSTKS